MNLYLIRHTKVNIPEGMIYGQTDVPLTQTFEQEANEVVVQLPKAFDAIYSSPLSRCRLLAKKISDNVIIDERLKELNFGDWEGKFWKDIHHTTEAKQWFAEYINTPCPNGESFNDLIERCRSFLIEIERIGCKKVCVVTHGGPIRAFNSLLKNIKPSDNMEIKVGFGEIVSFPNIFI